MKQSRIKKQYREHLKNSIANTPDGCIQLKKTLNEIVNWYDQGQQTPRK